MHGLKSFPKTIPQLEDKNDDDDEHDVEDNTDVWDVTSVLDNDFEEPNAWSVLDVESNLLLFKGSFMFGVELHGPSWGDETLNTEWSLRRELRLNGPPQEVIHLFTGPSYLLRKDVTSPPLMLPFPTKNNWNKLVTLFLDALKMWRN